MQRTALLAIRVVLHLGALSPLILLAIDYMQGNLTADPIREIQLRTGRYALLLLTLSLACTPVYNLTGFSQALAFRRPLGLYAFMYACLHLLNFVGLDYGFNFTLLWEDISGKRYVVAGFTAFLVLLALAVTSTAGWMRRLGRHWQRLHQLVYAAGFLVVVHYLWQLKVGFRGPLIYGIVIIILLLLRLPVLTRVMAGRLTRKRGRAD